MEVERQVGGGAHEGADAREPGDVRDFVQVGDDGRDAVRHDGAGVLVYPEMGAFDVGVTVDEAGQKIGAAKVDGLPRLIATAEAGDPPVEDDDVRLFDLGGERVDHAPVGEQQVAGGVAAGDRDQVGQAPRRPPAQVHGVPSTTWRSRRWRYFSERSSP